VPIVRQTFGAIVSPFLFFLTEVGRRLTAATGDARETKLLFQRISVAIPRLKAVISLHVQECFVVPEIEPDLCSRRW